MTPVIAMGVPVCRHTRPVDGQLCVDIGAALGGDPDQLITRSHPDLTALLLENGLGQHLLYSDYSPYTGKGIPNPSDCPDIGVSLCGGACAPCDGYCRGQSPTHPWGVCWPNLDSCTRAEPECPDGTACVVLTIGGPEQVNSDADGFCVPATECASAAANLPGGAECL